MINYEATQDGGNYLGKEVDITSIAAHFYSVLLPVRCFPEEERDQETFLVLTRRSHQSRDFSQIKCWLAVCEVNLASFAMVDLPATQLLTCLAI